MGDRDRTSRHQLFTSSCHQISNPAGLHIRLDGAADTGTSRLLERLEDVLRWLEETLGSWSWVILISPQGDKLRYVLRMDFLNASNNEAEYEALIHGMRMAKACGATHLDIYGDSNLVVE